MKIFLTDYASYNAGSQFEFGHWVNLYDFDNAEELYEYITQHFKWADERSPLPAGKREEIMITDYEGIPSTLYHESMNMDTFEKLYKLIDVMDEFGIEEWDNDGDNLLSLWNEYAMENGYEIIHSMDSVDDMFHGLTRWEMFMAGTRAKLNWTDNYVFLNGNGNIESTWDVSRHIDESALAQWVVE